VIRQQDVESLVGASRAEKVFGITDAIARRDAPGALALWEQVLATDRNAPFLAIGGLAYGFRKLAEARRLVEREGLPMAEAARQANVWGDPATVKRQLDRFSLGQLRDHLVQLLWIDVGTKTGLGSVPTSVERFLVQLCTAS
jgi:DNA polymerase III delta subunit